MVVSPYPNISITLNHLSDLPLYEQVKPYEIVLPELPKEVPQSNFQFTGHKIELHDVRNAEIKFDLETTGFMPFKHESKCLPAFEELDSNDDKALEVARPYLVETHDLIKDHLNAERVVVMDWKYREHQPKKNEKIAFVYEDYIEEKKGREVESDEGLPPNTWIPRYKGPSSHQIAHSDFSFASGIEAVERFFNADEVQKYCTPKYRIRIMNVWRPLIPYVATAPLAYCDRRTTKRSHLLAYDRIMPDRVAENALIVHRPEHKWYWISHQTPAEPMAFVVWDSDDVGSNVENKTPGLVAHGAFENPHGIGEAARRSVEVQMIVVTEREN